MSAALAASLQMSGFQDIHPHLSFLGRHCSCVPSWRMYAGYRHWPLSFAACWQSNMHGQEIMQPVQWPLLCYRRANAVEQPAWTASAAKHHLQIAGNVYVWLARPQCHVWTLRAPTRNLLTYLLTYLLTNTSLHN